MPDEVVGHSRHEVSVQKDHIDFSLTSLLVFGSGVSSTNELPGRERSLSTSLNACEIAASSCLLCSIVS